MIVTGSPAAPSHLVHVKSSNTLTTATITWESVGNNVSYTVNSTSAEAPFSEITQTSYTLCDLEVETDYVLSVTATNKCGIESPPSEEITVRIDLQGIMYMCMYAVQFSMYHQMLSILILGEVCVHVKCIGTNSPTCDSYKTSTGIMHNDMLANTKH